LPPFERPQSASGLMPQSMQGNQAP
jgi:hypothetical protein